MTDYTNPDHIYDRCRTMHVCSRLEDDIYDKDGKKYYQGRPLIHSGSSIDGGVCLGGGPREAIVVDSTNSGHPYTKNFCDVIIGHVQINPQYKAEEILQFVFDNVNENMKYDGDKVSEIINDLSAKGDKRISLDFFLKEGVGVCRHMALLAGVAIERLIKEDLLEGNICIERNGNRYRGAHAWARYKEYPIRNIHIIDVARLKEVMLLEAACDASDWNYHNNIDLITKKYPLLDAPKIDPIKKNSKDKLWMFS